LAQQRIAAAVVFLIAHRGEDSMTSPHPLQGAFDRVDRAKKHLADFEAVQIALGQTNHDAIVVKYDPNPPHPLMAEPNIIQPPSVAAILLGEAVYNLRAALDYLVFELVLKDARSEKSGTQFPICDTKSGFDRVAPKCLVGLNIPHRAAIESLQPYSGCDWTGRLRDVSNPDKHRRLVTGRSAFYINVSTFPKTEPASHFAPRLRSVRRAIHPQTNREMDVYLASEFPILIDVKGTPSGADLSLVTELLNEVQAGVRGTLEAFKPEF
jgi:hypothetical protein